METGINKSLGGGGRSLRDELAMPDSDDANDISAALYKEEINSRKIERLGSRITITSILLPCLTVAMLVYGYLDIKERVIAVHNSDQIQVDVVAKEVEAKLNALEVDIARIKFSFEKDIPELKQQTIAIQDEVTLLAGIKPDKEKTEKNIELLKASIDKIADQYQGALHILDRTNQETLDIVNEKTKELESLVKSDVESVKTMRADIDAKIQALKAVESGIDGKIDSKVASVVDKRSEAAIDNRVKNIINEKLASHSQVLDKKIADIDLAVESKLAALEEVTQILAESKTDITKLQTNITSLKDNVGVLDKEFKNYQVKAANNINSNIADKKVSDKVSDINKKYIDSQITSLNKNVNSRIDELDLKLSRKILQYATQLESSTQSKNSASKKKNDKTIHNDSAAQSESAGEENKPPIILKKTEHGKILETDLLQ
ncbi:MAG: hypothetical protein HQK73_00140 [Desulfamplus sp.]|nr:hypothetical protein [Desulfamplus sp.]